MLNHILVGHGPAVELPNVIKFGVDLLFETSPTRELVAIYFLYENDPLLPLRMFDGAVSVFDAYGRYPRQFGLYFGSQPLTMPSHLEDPDIARRYTITDIREFEAETLLKSPNPADVVLAILGRNSDRPATIRRILRRIAKMQSPDQEAALMKLFVLAELRRLRDVVKEEAERMSLKLDLTQRELLASLPLGNAVKQPKKTTKKAEKKVAPKGR